MRRSAPALLAALLLLVLSTSATAAGIVRPDKDPFYAYSGATPLAKIKPGTVLKTRAVTLGIVTDGIPIPAEQLLYRTADELGRPSVTVTTVAVPPGAAVAPKIVAYLSFYDSLSAKCDPSYTLQGGDPGSNNTELTVVEQGLVLQYYTAGFVTTVPDFEGTGLHWTAGHEAGYGTLDAIRATESYLKAPATTPVGLSGYSGGSIAADWASELAPSYAKELNIVGVAEGGVPVDFAHNLAYVDGSQVWSGVLPAALVALTRAYDIKLDPYLSAYGRKLTKQDSDECIGDFSGTTPGGKIAALLKPEYADVTKVPVFAKVLNSLIMGTVPGHPKGPLFIAVGNDPKNAQGQGDDIMVTKDDEALAHEYCSEGVSLQYTVISNSTHEQAALQFEPQATAFLTERLNGIPFTGDNCASVGPGNSLAPLKIQSASQPTRAATPTKTSSARPTAVGSDLPTTGFNPLVGVLALLVLASGGIAVQARR